ncbi:MAG: type I restriction enzyme M protein [Phenylobacterium sp.]|jgi:type I restriction enzyme M protein
MSNKDIVQELWYLCDILRDSGISYSEHLTELVQLLFIKMVHQNSDAELLKQHPLPKGCRWTDLTSQPAAEQLAYYQQMLSQLSSGKDGQGNPVHDDLQLLGIYAHAQTRLSDPRHLTQLIKSLDLLNFKEHNLGDLFEDLLAKNASENTKTGAGQYFTPRVLIRSMVRNIKPSSGQIIQDPAMGTGGFFAAAHNYINQDSDLAKNTVDPLTQSTFIGVEQSTTTHRLALTNCLLHDIEGKAGVNGPIYLGDTLGQIGAELEQADIILTKLPFGRSDTARHDLPFATNNKQLIYLQHSYHNLKPGGRAAIILSDNALFEAGIGADIRRDLMDKCNLHTILRLPVGLFYAAGLKSNVLFFSKGSATDKHQQHHCTEQTWIYDLRSNMPAFGRRNSFDSSQLKSFERLYGENPDGTSARKAGDWHFTPDDKIDHSDFNRWRCFSRDFIHHSQDDSLDIRWIKDKNAPDTATLPPPAELANKAMIELKSALSGLKGLMKSLEHKG